MRKIEHWWYFLFDLAVFHVRDESDDLDVEITAAAPPNAHALSHGVAAKIEFLGELLVDDRHTRCARIVRWSEFATGDQRNAKRPKISWTDGIETRSGVGVGAGLEALHANAFSPIVAREQRHHA